MLTDIKDTSSQILGKKLLATTKSQLCWSYFIAVDDDDALDGLAVGDPGLVRNLQNVFGGRCVDHVALDPDVLDPGLELLALPGVPGDVEPVGVFRVRGGTEVGY